MQILFLVGRICLESTFLNDYLLKQVDFCYDGKPFILNRRTAE